MLPYDKTCPACLAGNTLTALEGICAACGHRFARLFVIGYDEPPWNYSEPLMEKFRAHDGLRLMSPYEGATPERLEELRHARELYLSRYRDFSFRHLAGFDQLEDFELDFTRVGSLEGIGPLPKLSILSLTECRRIDDISSIASVPSLRFVTIALCSQLRDYSPLASLPAAMSIFIEARSVASLSFLRACPSLKVLSLRVGKVEDADFAPLFDLAGLDQLNLTVRGLPRRTMPKLREALPTCQITVNAYD